MVLLNLERLRLLRLVGMLTACKHVQLPEHAPAERILRQHALDRELDHALGVLAEKLLERDRLDAADVSGMVVVDLVGEFASGDTDLLRIHHHDVVAHVHVRAVISLVLALEAMGNLRGQPPERLVAGVDDEPIAPDGTGPGKYGLHRSLVAVRPPSGENPGTAGGRKKAGKCTQAGAAMQRRPCGPREGLPLVIALYNRGLSYGVRSPSRLCHRRPGPWTAIRLCAGQDIPARPGRFGPGTHPPGGCGTARQRGAHARQPRR